MSNTSSPADAKKVKRIAIYTRKSNDDNLATNVTSLDAQKSCCRSYISIQKANQWEECQEVFDDAAESGRSLKRPAMQRLLKRIEEGRIDGVIVYKLDRLTRNSKDFHSLLELFEKHDVAFISATESIDTKSPQGRLMTAIMVQFAQYDREMDQERSKDFHLARAKKGLWCGGVSPLGYDSKEKLLVVNETEADIVRRIFDLYLQYQSTIRVAEEINRLGFRRKTHKTKEGRVFGGKHFNINSVIRILQRKVYIGLVTNERTKQDFPGQQQPIVSPAVFERAQELLKSHTHRVEGQISHAANKYGFRLKGLVRCGECGSAVSSYVRPKKEKVYRYYKCLAKLNGLPVKCGFTSIGAQKIEEFVIEKLAALGWNRPFLERLVRKERELSRGRMEPLKLEREQTETRLATIRKGIGNLVTLARDSNSQEVREELSRLDVSKKTLEARLIDLQAEIGYCGKLVYDVNMVEATLRHFARHIYRIPIQLQIQTIQRMVKRVVLFKNKVQVELYELPVENIQQSMGAKIIEGEIKNSKVRIPPRSKGASIIPPSEGTAVVEVEQNWRGRRDSNPRSSP